MQMTCFPEIVQVVPHSDYTVSVYFSDGKIVSYDVKRTGDPADCIDIDPETLYALDAVEDRLAVS